MYLKFFKSIPIVLLLAIFVLPQNALAQSNAEQMLKASQQGQLTNPTAQEKQIISEYHESNQTKGPYFQRQVLSPDATYYIDEDFSGFSFYSEDFDYTAATVLTDNGWIQSGTTSTNPITVTSPGLTFTGYPSVAGNAVTLINTGQDDYYNYSANGPSVGSVYMSFMLNVSAAQTGDYFIALSSASQQTNYYDRIHLKSSGSGYVVGVSKSNEVSGGAIYGTTELAFNTTYVIVTKYVFNEVTTTDDAISIYIIDSTIPLTEPLTAEIDSYTEVTKNDVSDISTVTLRQGSSSAAPTLVVDGIRVGTSWESLFIDGVSGPAGWTQNILTGDPAFDYWHFDNPGARTLNSPITDPAAIFDSDDYSAGGGAEDVALESPSFDATASTTVFVDWDEYFYAAAGGGAHLDVFNGSVWLNDIYFSTTTSTNPAHNSIDISAYVAGVTNAQVRFRWTGNWSYYWILDNVQVYEPDAFPNPAVLVSPPDAGTGVLTTATLNWVAGGGVAPTGYYINFGTDNPPTNIESNTDLGLVTTYTPGSALAYSTTYYWEIIPYNLDGNATGTVVWSFTTGADPTITTLPYTENFDGVTAPALPYGWSTENTNGDGVAWATSSGTAHSAPNKMRISYNTTLAMDDWFFSPPIQLTGGTSYTVKFWYRGTSFDESMELLWGTSASSTGMTEGPIFDDPSFSFNTYTEATASFTPTTTGTYYLGWHGYSIPDQNAIYVDDVTVQETTYGTLSGTITNCFDATPLDGATVTAGTYSATTNASGFYEILNILTGDYDVTASKLGFAEATVTGVTVVETGTTQDICLNELLFPPINLQASVTGQDVNLTWQAPDADQWVSWNNNPVYGNAIGLTAGGTFEVSARFPSSVMLPLMGKNLTDVEIFINTLPTSCVIKIYDQGTSTTPGTLLYSEDITTSIVGTSFNNITLAAPVAISGNDIWIGYEVTHAAGDNPAGTDPGPATADGDWIYLSPGPWQHMAGLGLNYNWLIAGYVATPGPNAMERSKIFANNSSNNININNEPMKIELSNDGMFAVAHTSLQAISQNRPTNLSLQERTVGQASNGYGADANFLGYNVYRDGSPIATDVANVFYDDLGLAFGNNYSYTVTAHYTEGESAPAGPVSVSIAYPAAGLPFAEDFETWPNNWNVVNGTQTNQWFVGTAAVPYSGTNSAYVSSDGGTTWGYDNTASSVVHLFRDITFTGSVGGGYTLKFWWKGTGEPSIWDYMRVSLVETDVTPTEGILTSGQVGQPYYFDQVDYIEETILLPESVDGTTKRLVFSWRNDGTLGGPEPISIDDISIDVTLTGDLNGTVTNCVAPFDPLEGATVTAGTYSTTTNASGFYEFLGIPNGTYDVTASRLGFASNTITGVAVTAGGTTTQDICLDETLIPPIDLQASVLNQDVQLTWQAPPNNVIRWDGQNNGNGIGVGGGTFEVSARFDASLMNSLTGKELRELEIFIGPAFDNITLKIYDQGTPTSPGTQLYSEDVTSQIVGNSWNLLTLTTPITLSGNDIWIGYEVTHTGSTFPAGCDDGPMVYPDGQWTYLAPGPWAPLSDLAPTLTFNWNVAGLVYDAGPIAEAKPIVINTNPSNKMETESLNNLRNNSKIKSDRFKSIRENGESNQLSRKLKSRFPQQFGSGVIDATLTGYNVYRDGAPIASGVTDLFYNDNGVAYGTYSYTVTAVYTEGESVPAGPVIVEVVDPNAVTVNVYPQSVAYWTGNTEGTVKTDGEINTVYPNYGWAVFDISSIPDDATITSINFYGYVNANNWPYWGITPMGTVNPVTDDAATIYSEIIAGTSNEYSFSPEPGTLPIDWLNRQLTGTAITDMQTALTQDWFAVGFWDDDGIPTYYINFDGWSQTNPPYLEVSYSTGGGTTFPLSVDIADGWNMVSVPGTNPAGMAPLDWWADLTGTVFEFVPGTGYNGITTTMPTQGYWLKNVGTTTYNYAAIEMVTNNPIPAASGWNMLGGYEDIVDVTLLTTNPAGQLITPIYEYVPGSGYFAATDLVPGYGYWVKTASACDVIIPNVVLAKGSGEKEEYFKKDWGKIMISDATGKHYTLYAVTGEVDLDRYELPPLPPAGSFDIRFGSGRIAEDINSSLQTIDMSGVTYPLTVRVEGMDIRLMDEIGSRINVNVKSGEEVEIGDATIQKLTVTGELIPAVYALEQNYPNPFNPSTVIEFSLPEDVSNVKLSIYNALGEKVAELVNTNLAAGKYQYQWNAKNVATGMYIYELRTDKFVSVKKMLLLK